MSRRWWLALGIAFVACLVLVAAQGARPWERFDDRPHKLGRGPEVVHGDIAYRLVARETGETIQSGSDEPRHALPGARLVMVVVEQRQAGPDPVWEFCSLRLGTRDGLVWADEPDGYGRPDDLPRESSCATDTDIPDSGEAYRFGRILMVPAHYSETAEVVLLGADGVIRLAS